MTIVIEQVSFWPRFFAVYISVSYLLLCVISGIQLVRTVLHGHKIQSFRFGFLSLCFLWTLLRVVFYFFDNLDDWPAWLTTVLFYLPNACQVATFSMLILFYAKLVNEHRWREQRPFYTITAYVVNGVMMVLIGVYAGLASGSEVDDQAQQTYDTIYFVSQALFFGSLVVLAMYYIRKLVLSRQSHLQVGLSRAELLTTAVVFLIFFTRCVFDLLAAFNIDIFVHKISEVQADNGRRVKLLHTSTFFLVFIWEIVPTLMVLIFFRKMPPTRNSWWAAIEEFCGLRKRCRCCYSAVSSPEPSDQDPLPSYHGDMIDEAMFTPTQQPAAHGLPPDDDLKDPAADSLFNDNMRYDSEGWKKTASYRQFGAESPF